jgi:flagellar assembly protein FliH
LFKSLIIKGDQAAAPGGADGAPVEMDESGPGPAAGVCEYIFEPFRGTAGSAALTYQEARQMLARARQEAARLKEEAAREGRAQGAVQGREEGFRQGVEEARAQVRTEFDAALGHTARLLQAIDTLYQDIFRNMEAELVKLALTVAERVLFHEASVSPKAVSAALEAALARLDQAHRVVLRVHPDDLASLETVQAEFKDKLSGLTKIAFEPDASLRRGDLIVESEAGRIDSTLRRRLAAVTADIDQALKKSFDLV